MGLGKGTAKTVYFWKTVIFMFWLLESMYRVKCLVLESILTVLSKIDHSGLNSWSTIGSQTAQNIKILSGTRHFTRYTCENDKTVHFRQKLNISVKFHEIHCFP